MMGEIFYTLFEIAVFFSAFYLLMLSLMKDWEKRKLDKSCPHCKEYTGKGWKSFLTPARQ